MHVRLINVVGMLRTNSITAVLQGKGQRVAPRPVHGIAVHRRAPVNPVETTAAAEVAVVVAWTRFARRDLVSPTPAVAA